MQVLQAVMLGLRAEILRSARLPRHMAVEAAVLALGRLQHLLAEAAEASVQRVRQQAPPDHTEVAAEAMARLLRASAPWVVAVAGVDAALPPLQTQVYTLVTGAWVGLQVVG